MSVELWDALVDGDAHEVDTEALWRWATRYWESAKAFGVNRRKCHTSTSTGPLSLLFIACSSFENPPLLSIVTPAILYILGFTNARTLRDYYATLNAIYIIYKRWSGCGRGHACTQSESQSVCKSALETRESNEAAWALAGASSKAVASARRMNCAPML